MQENVAKTRLEYERCLEQFSLAKAKHEEQKSKGSKRSDEYRDRYIKVGWKSVINDAGITVAGLNFYPIQFCHSLSRQ